MRQPVIVIFDAGKTNKKLLVFDEDYNVLHVQSERIPETIDEDGDRCEDINSLKEYLLSSLDRIFQHSGWDVKAFNCSAYGASFVLTDEDGNPVLPMCNYLKAYPSTLQEKFYRKYGGEEFAVATASPVLGNLNSGMQLYRLRNERPSVLNSIRFALHLPQYLSFLVTRRAVSELTSIGCHTALWDFSKSDYHAWVAEEGVFDKLAPIVPSTDVIACSFKGHEFISGRGLHDSSSALIPYIQYMEEPFVLISTGTWCISMNPFNHEPLTAEELRQDCLCYLQHNGLPVKASRLFAGYEHEEQVKRIADHFQLPTQYFSHISFDVRVYEVVTNTVSSVLPASHTIHEQQFAAIDLAIIPSALHAYYLLMMDIVNRQYLSTKLAIGKTNVTKIIVDGGFSNNSLYMHLLACRFCDMNVYSADIPNASALGAAIVIEDAWNTRRFSGSKLFFQQYSPAFTGKDRNK